MTDYTYLFEFIFGSSRRLNNIIRYNTRHRSTNENVAAHSLYVAIYALILSKILINLGKKIDIEKVLTRAILHDIEECVAGDVLKNIKADPDMHAAYDKIAEVSTHSVIKMLPSNIKDSLFSEWKKCTSETEGWVVDIADELSGIAYSREQMLMGNKYFKDIFIDYSKRLHKLVENTELNDIYETLISPEIADTLISYEKEN